MIAIANKIQCSGPVEMSLKALKLTKIKRTLAKFSKLDIAVRVCIWVSWGLTHVHGLIMMWGKAGQRHISKSTNKLKIWKIRSVNGLFRSKHNQIKSAKAQDNASFTAFSKKFLNSRPSKTTTNFLAEKSSYLQKNFSIIFANSR